MSGGRDLAGGEKRRGRPPGSKNRRAKDLKGFIDGRYGGSAAQQSAAVCMVTPGELKAAGGSMAKAQVSKALDLVHHVRDAKDRLDDELQAMVTFALELLLATYDHADTAKARRALVDGFIDRVQHLGGEFGLAQAMKMIADERAALLPYTDQRQPLAIEASGAGFQPSVVFMAAAPGQHQVEGDADIAGEFRVLDAQVSPLKSHGEGQALEPADLFAPEPTD